MSDTIPFESVEALRAEALPVEELRRALWECAVTWRQYEEAVERLQGIAAGEAAERLGRVVMLLQGSESWARGHMARHLLRWFDDGLPAAVKDEGRTYVGETQVDGSAWLVTFREGEAPDLDPGRVLDLPALEADLLSRACVALGLSPEATEYVTSLGSRYVSRHVREYGSIVGCAKLFERMYRIKVGLD